MARYDKQTNLTGKKGFPSRGKDFSALGINSNQNTFGSQKFQESALGMDPLITGPKSALSRGNFQPNGSANAILSAGLGAQYDTPNGDLDLTFNLLAECGNYDGFTLITECPADNQQDPSVVSPIQWITQCDQ
jgi:hypothetical protein